MSEDQVVPSGEAVVVPVEPVVAEVKPVEPVADAPKDTPAEGEKPAEQKPEDHEERLRENRVQKRIDSLTRKRYEAEARAKVLEEELNRYREQGQQQQNPVDERPKREQYQSEEDFLDAYHDWRDLRKNRIDQTAPAVHNEAKELWTERVEAIKVEYPDFVEKVSAAKSLPIGREFSSALSNSELDLDIQYYLAQNPLEALKTLDMSPIKAMRFVEQLEDKIIADKQIRASQKADLKKVSKAPAPIVPVKPVGGDAHIDIYDPKTDINRFMYERNKQLAGK